MKNLVYERLLFGNRTVFIQTKLGFFAGLIGFVMSVRFDATLDERVTSMKVYS